MNCFYVKLYYKTKLNDFLKIIVNDFSLKWFIAVHNVTTIIVLKSCSIINNVIYYMQYK